MTEWSEEGIHKAELALSVMQGTGHEKIRSALDAAIVQRTKEEIEARNERLRDKIVELEGK